MVCMWRRRYSLELSFLFCSVQMSFTVQRRLQAILHHVCGMDPAPPSEKKVAPQDRFETTIKDALDFGRDPCKVCKPGKDVR